MYLFVGFPFVEHCLFSIGEMGVPIVSYGGHFLFAARLPLWRSLCCGGRVSALLLWLQGKVSNPLPDG